MTTLLSHQKQCRRGAVQAWGCEGYAARAAARYVRGGAAKYALRGAAAPCCEAPLEGGCSL
eukprot:349592-Chlamydomonas_euryale.AAC.3